MVKIGQKMVNIVFECPLYQILVQQIKSWQMGIFKFFCVGELHVMIYGMSLDRCWVNLSRTP